MESDIRYFRRRACEEMAAASRAVTDAARERRLQLVDLYVQRLEALKAPSPFDDEAISPGCSAPPPATARRSPGAATSF